jgi:hypothetical protein
MDRYTSYQATPILNWLAFCGTGLALVIAGAQGLPFAASWVGGTVLMVLCVRWRIRQQSMLSEIGGRVHVIAAILPPMNYGIGVLLASVARALL